MSKHNRTLSFGRFTGWKPVLLIAAALGFAEAHAAEPPFSGVVTRDNATVLSGPGETYYAVGTLKSGDKVEVKGLLYDWYEIEAPAGFFSYVSKEYVKLNADGKSAVVTGDRVRVRAPAPEGPAASYKYQLRLDKGESVTVLGDAGEFYRIASPPGVRVYIAKELARPAGAGDTATPGVAKPQPVKGGDAAKPVAGKPKPAAPVEAPLPPAEGVVVVSLDAEGNATIDGHPYEIDELDRPIGKALADKPELKVTIRSEKQTPYESVKAAIEKVKAAGVTDVKVAAIEAVPAGAPTEPKGTEGAAATPGAAANREPRIEDLEKRFFEASKQPLLDQPVGELRVEYEKLLAGESLSPTDRALAKARVDMLDHRRELQSRLGDVKALRQEIDAARKDREELEKHKPKRYAAVGRLQASTIYTGEKLPLLYRVFDPSNGLTVAYIQPPARSEDTYAALVGQYVGVTGDKDYDPTLKLDVVRAKEVDVLAPKQ